MLETEKDIHRSSSISTRVIRYDGQNLWVNEGPSPDYELGSFLGGGGGGVVYEAQCLKTQSTNAIKVLNPIGYKLNAAGSLNYYEVAVKGTPWAGESTPMVEANVWWLLNPNTRQLVAAYQDRRSQQLKEITLKNCIQIWGLNPKGLAGQQQRAGSIKGGKGGVKQHKEKEFGEEWEKAEKEKAVGRKNNFDPKSQQSSPGSTDQVFVNGEMFAVPAVPPKYATFLTARARIFREIASMRLLSSHPNILALREVLELVQDSKSTVFLVMELARGGELFDRIKVDCGAEEQTARGYFRQLLGGVRHCHERGVCHRDLKPENLLLADHGEHPILKIADFGFSAMLQTDDDVSAPLSQLSIQGGQQRQNQGRDVRRLRSCVGSPYYVAPEVLRASSELERGAGGANNSVNGGGYDGTKADVWSMGVILYAMLAGNLPFEKDLHSCARFEKFGSWVRGGVRTRQLREHCRRLRTSNTSTSNQGPGDMSMDYPSWFFMGHLSASAKSLLCAMLHPDPQSRISVRQALRHPWVCNGGREDGSSSSGSSSPKQVASHPSVIRGAAARAVDEYDSELDAQTQTQGNRGNRVAPSVIHTHTSAANVVTSSNISTTTVVVASSQQQAQVQGQAPADLVITVTEQPRQPQSQPAPQSFNTFSPSPSPSPSGSILIDKETGKSRSNSFFSPPLAPRKTHNRPTDVSVPPLLPSATLGSEGVVMTQQQGLPPAFRDHVARSTRFITNVPATAVLQKISSIINADPHPLPYPYRNITQKAVVHWAEYKLEVWRGCMLVCTVQVFLMRQQNRAGAPGPNSSQGSYLVEFMRGQIDIFHFKRIYESVRRELSALVKQDYALSFLETFGGQNYSNNLN